MNKPMSPCKDCIERTEACHDQCEDYLRYRAELTQYKEKYRQINSYSSYRAERFKEYRRKKK